jgi:uncharacterized protein (TIGR02145 family)
MNINNFIIVSFLVASGFCYPQLLRKKTGDNPNTIAPSAVYEIESTTKGFLPPRMSFVQQINISSPATGLIIYCTDCGSKGELQIFNGIAWTAISGSPPSLNVAIVPTSTGGTLEFLAHNLGADTTVNPLQPSWKLNGAYFQWGKKPVDTNGDNYKTKLNDGVAGFGAAPTGTLSTNANSAAITSWSATVAGSNDWSNLKTVYDPCPSGYRVPTFNEWLSILPTTNTWTNTGNWTADPINYSSGKLVASTILYLPAAGYRDTTGLLVNRNNQGGYWSSTSFDSTKSKLLFFTSTAISTNYVNNSLVAYSVRCVKE